MKVENFTRMSETAQRHELDQMTQAAVRSAKLRKVAARLSRDAGHKVTDTHFLGRTDAQLVSVIRELENYLRNLPEKTEQAPPAKKRHRRRKPKSQKVEA